MSKIKAEFPFLQFPPELRDFIYICALYDENDERIGYHCPTILLINRQIYSEASRLQYAKTHTLTVSRRHISFMNWEYIKEALPRSFPYHKLEALRIRILRPMTKDFIFLAYDLHTILADYQYFWPLFEEHMEQLSILMGAIVDKGLPLRKLILDVRSPCVSREPLNSKDYGAMHLSICAVFGMLSFNNKAMAQTIEIVLGSWAKDNPETIKIAHNWGYAALCHDSRESGIEKEKRGPFIRFEAADAEQSLESGVEPC